MTPFFTFACECSDPVSRCGPFPVPIISRAVTNAINCGHAFSNVGPSIECIRKGAQAERLPHRVVTENWHIGKTIVELTIYQTLTPESWSDWNVDIVRERVSHHLHDKSAARTNEYSISTGDNSRTGAKCIVGTTRGSCCGVS
jgi:hypothetical protein